jgi:hypothetical protein
MWHNIPRIQITKMQFPEYHFYVDVYDGHVSVCFWSRDVACGAAMQTDSSPTRLEIERGCLYTRSNRSEISFGKLLGYLFGI